MRTAVEPLAHVRELFPPAAGYLNSATCGLPPLASLEAMHSHLDEWRDGGACLIRWDQPVQRSRELAAQILGVPASWMSVGSQLAVTAGTVAASLRPGTRVVLPSGDFSSLSWPFVARGDLEIVQLPVSEVIAALRPGDWCVASHVQSSDGAMLDLDELARTAQVLDVRTFLDVTQSAGWCVIDASRFDVVSAGAYKWLMCPRGTAFTSWSPRALEEIAPQNPNWYAGRDTGQSLYLDTVDLAQTARRHDVSPAWPCWAGAVASLELITRLGPAEIGRHNVGLANQLRAGLGLPESSTAIVSVRAEAGIVDKLAAQGIKAGYRNGRARMSLHLYNDEDDVLAVLPLLR